jgi:hypothetical protein
MTKAVMARVRTRVIILFLVDISTSPKQNYQQPTSAARLAFSRLEAAFRLAGH